MNTSAGTKCEAAIQGKNTSFFHRCQNLAKTDARTYDGQSIKVCGVHVRNDTHLIRFTGR
jgi:hypothetical protein